MKKAVSIFGNKNHRKILFCTIIGCISIVTILLFINIKKIDVYGHNMLIFIAGRGSAYLLNPVIIKTEFGNINLKRFAKFGWPYIGSDADTRTRFDWYAIELNIRYMGKSIVCNLNLFGQNIEVANSVIELRKNSIIIHNIYMPIIINEEEEIVLGFSHYPGSNEVNLTLRAAPPFYMTTTLYGEIVEINYN